MLLGSGSLVPACSASLLPRERPVMQDRKGDHKCEQALVSSCVWHDLQPLTSSCHPCRKSPKQLTDDVISLPAMQRKFAIPRLRQRQGCSGGAARARYREQRSCAEILDNDDWGAAVRGRKRRKMQRSGTAPEWARVALAAIVLVVLHRGGSAQSAGRSTIRQYFFCLGGDLEGFACQGLADKTTCGQGSECVEDLYVDACGNGYRMQEEECDDGNTVEGDGCSAECTVETGWQCSGATDREPDTCSVVCGDGRQLSSGCCDDAECSRECSPIWGCDDGNLEDNDGCSKSCSVESGYSCWPGDLNSLSPCLCNRARISASSEHTCAIDDKAKISCWGNNTNNKTEIYFNQYDGAYAWPLGSWNPQDVFVAVATGAEHNCATKFSGAIICWGWRGPGGIGDGRIYMPPAPDWERNSGGGLLWGQISLG